MIFLDLIIFFLFKDTMSPTQEVLTTCQFNGGFSNRMCVLLENIQEHCCKIQHCEMIMRKSSICVRMIGCICAHFPTIGL